VIGAALGILSASLTDTKNATEIVGLLMIFTLFVIVWKPGKRKNIKAFLFALSAEKRAVLDFALFLFVGIYGGFIQAGVGILIVVILSNFTHYTVIKANALKMVIVGIYTVPILALYIYWEYILWDLAVLLGIGQIVGTRLTARYIVGYKYIDNVIYYLLIIMVSASIIKIFGGSLLVSFSSLLQTQ
jgi:uncharacterized membrane protein YfcA